MEKSNSCTYYQYPKREGGEPTQQNRYFTHTHTQESYLKIKTFRAHAIPLNTIDNYIATEC